MKARKWLLILILFLLTVLVAGVNSGITSRAQETDPNPGTTGLTIQDLIARPYGAGDVRRVQTLNTYQSFTRELIVFDSDGLQVYGFMNVPTGAGPFPVVILVHGYVDPTRYQTLTYTTRYADQLARAGYLVIHPSLRNHRPSDVTDDLMLFRVGYAADVLNLVAHVREQGGQPGLLEKADATRLGLWGHSMGGSIVLRAITVDPTIDAAVLYGSMSGDERLNSERRFNFWGSADAIVEYRMSPASVALVSPSSYLDRIQSAVSIHHGGADADVPLAWSVDLCSQLTARNKTVECETYDGQGHILQGASDRRFQTNVVNFFATYLR